MNKTSEAAAEQDWKYIVRADDKGKIDFNGLAKSRYLTLLWVKRNFIAQYKQTVLGPAWAVIQPFFSTVVYSIFFGSVAGLGAAGVPNFIFYLSGNVIWHVFAGCLSGNSAAFTSNAGIFSKVYFPRLVMPISTALSQFITFAIQFVFMLGFLIYYMATGEVVHPTWFALFTPLLLAQLAAFGMACGIIISSLTTKYRDLQKLVGFGITLWMYCSPVTYDMFSRKKLSGGGLWYNLYMLNPVTPVVNFFRYAWLGIGRIDWLFYGISLAVTVALVLVGFKIFSRVEKTFLDTV